MNHKLDTDSQVFFYEQDFYVLSNFSAFTLIRGDVRYDTSEAAYQVCKFAHKPEIQWAIRMAPSAHEAFKIAQENKRYQWENWDKHKNNIMKEILISKANQHEYVMRKLLATGNRELVEDSWRDDYWGWGENRDGKNVLGKLWMEVREAIRSKK